MPADNGAGNNLLKQGRGYGSSFLFLLLIAGCVSEPVGEATLAQAEQDALSYLATQQLPSGEFASLASGNKALGNPSLNPTPFFTSAVLHSIQFVDAERGMVDRGLRFLKEDQKGNQYWNTFSNAPVNSALDVPEDVDDSSMAGGVLVLHGEEIGIDFESARAPNGAFYTWLPEEGEEWENDVDCVANANVMYLYALQGKEDASLCQYINSRVREQAYLECTGYYISPYAFPYFVSRAYRDAGGECLEESMPILERYVSSRHNAEGWGSAQDTALALVTLMNAGYEGALLDEGMRQLLKQQNADGGWHGEAFFVGPYNCLQKHACVYFGGSVHTTALVLEAIGKYRGIRNGERGKGSERL